MSAWNGIYEDDGDDHRPCGLCGEEHPAGVLEDGRCPGCVDEPDLDDDNWFEDPDMGAR